MRFPPLADNPLTSRDDLQRATRDLFEPLLPYFSKGNAQMMPGSTGYHYSPAGAGLEGFSRPLWALAPLAAGGGRFQHWAKYREGLDHGTDPGHDEYWGVGPDGDQRYVEYAAIGLALALAGDELWTPLNQASKDRLAVWLSEINRHTVGDNNWLFFRVLANLGLDAVGAEADFSALESALDRVDAFYRGDGWYSDGDRPQLDYYVPFAMHYYGLIYARLRGRQDPERATLYRERAARFALDFQHWFAADGGAVPFGRSLTYRFAQGAFWSALAFADVEALPWGEIKGLALRHLRWWLRRPIFTETGILTVGYGYPNLLVSEEYNAPGSPYWAMKSFLPLALPETHPFWQAEEAPHPLRQKTTVSVQKRPGMLLCRDAERDHVFALASGQYASFKPRHTPEKYAKFAYSTAFGFCVGGESKACLPDNMIALSEEGYWWRSRCEVTAHGVSNDVLWSTWQPWPDVTIRTWLVPCPPWHLRIHEITTERALQSREGGFALNPGVSSRTELGPGHALVRSEYGLSGLRDLAGTAKGEIIPQNGAAPNVNLLHPRIRIPSLHQDLAPGSSVLLRGVLGLPGPTDEHARALWNEPPCCTPDDTKFFVSHAGRTREIFR